MSSQRPRKPTRRSAPPSAVPGRQSYHHGDLRAALLDATHALIRERGSTDLSLREVARRAQVSHGAPAHHFRNKAGLLTAFAAQGFERLVATIAELERERPAGNGPERLTNTGRGYLRFAVRHPAQFSIMFATEALDVNDPALVEASHAAYDLLIGAIAACVQEGFLLAEEAPLATVASWSLVHGFAALWNGGRLRTRSGAQVPEALGDQAVDLFVASLTSGKRDTGRGPK